VDPQKQTLPPKGEVFVSAGTRSPLVKGYKKAGAVTGF